MFVRFARTHIMLMAAFLAAGCSASKISRLDEMASSVSVTSAPAAASATPAEGETPGHVDIYTGDVDPIRVVHYAETLIGVPYRYGSMTRSKGFDCSGFINYVFRHFHIATPRSSVDFTNAGTPVPLDDSRPGDLILFTGTDTTGRIVGHMGIITQNDNGQLHFIHSSSGRNHIGVIISALSRYYTMRLVKVIRVFPQNNDNQEMSGEKGMRN